MPECSLTDTIGSTGKFVGKPKLPSRRTLFWYLYTGVTHRLCVLQVFHAAFKSPESLGVKILSVTEQLKSTVMLRHLTQHRLIVVALSTALMLLSACSSPPVADFTSTGNSGNAPYEVSFLLGDLADADAYSWDFGDGSGSTENEPVHTFEFAGEFVVTMTATRGDSIDTSQTSITVEPGEAGWVVIEVGELPISPFESTQFTASAFDVLGNPIENTSFSWSVDESLGDIDSSGRFVAATDLGSFEDAVSVELERLGATVSATADLEIIAGPLHTFSITPTVLDLRVGRTETIEVQAVDEAGHVLDAALVLYTSLRDGDSIDSTGLFTAGLNASSDEVLDLVTIEVELDGKAIETTISGTIRPGILDQVHVAALPTVMEVGESIQLSSFATDRFGNELELDELIWSVSSPEIGSITENGMFTAGTIAGEHTDVGITARGVLDGIESVTVAPLTIIAGAVEFIHIVPDSDSVPIGAGSPFVVLATDSNGNIIDVPEEEYIYEYSTAGRGQEVAVFIAGYEIGDFENAITVTLPAGVAGNAEALVAQSDITVRQRSSNIIAVEVVDQDGGGIFLIDLETAQLGSADISFHQNDAVELSPSWWPDGSRLVYVSDPTGELQVYTLNLASREIVQITNVAGGVSMPNISPDGQSMVFVSLVSDQWQLWVADIPEDVAENPITLDSAVRISRDDTAQHILPYWSPDSTKILASQNTSEGLVRVMLFDPEAVIEPEVLGPFGSVGFGWTPDGTGIRIGLATADGALNLGTLTLGENTPEFIDASLEFLVAAWAPDGSEVVAIDSLLGAGWLLDTDGSGLRRVVDSAQVPTRMSWRPREYGDPVPIPEFEGDPAMLEPGDELRGPVGALDTSLSYSAVISTDAGDIEVELFDEVAPMTVENFVNLARTGFYDGLGFQRVIEEFVSQAGDPPGDEDGAGYIFNDEFSRGLSHDGPGVLSMANAGSNTNGSQFFITHAAATWLDAYENDIAKNCADDSVSCHAIFGRVTSGLEIVTSMAERDPETATEPAVKILSILIVES